jgi:hypothetical protein
MICGQCYDFGKIFAENFFWRKHGLFLIQKPTYNRFGGGGTGASFS